jgi:hypothetical protein
MSNSPAAICLPCDTDSHGKAEWEAHLTNSEDTLILKNDGDLDEHETGVCDTARLTKVTHAVQLSELTV